METCNYGILTCIVTLIQERAPTRYETVVWCFFMAKDHTPRSFLLIPCKFTSSHFGIGNILIHQLSINMGRGQPTR